MSDDNPWGDSVLTFHHVGAGNEILSQTKLKNWSYLLSNDVYPAAGDPMRSVGLGGHNAQVADASASLRKENTTKREKGVCLTCCQVSSGRVGVLSLLSRARHGQFWLTPHGGQRLLHLRLL